MNPRFQVHPDGYIIIQNGADLYTERCTQFLADCVILSLPVLSLPQSEIYAPGTGLHCGFTANDQHAPALEEKTDDLDVLIAAAKTLAALKKKREDDAEAARAAQFNKGGP